MANNLYILDGLTEGLLAVLSNDGSKKCPYFDAVHTEQLNKDHTFEFSVPADHKDSAYVQRNNLVVFKDSDGDYQLFQIYKTEEEHDGTQLLIKAYAEHSFFEMVDDIIEDLRTVDGTADSAMTDALSKSRWKKGTVADLGLRTTNFYYESAVSSIQKIISTWGGELKKRVGFDGSAISERFVDLPARRGADTGKRFEYTKDLVSIKRTVDISNLKTALYGRGKGEQTEMGGYTRRITFADEIWNASGSDPVDKLAGQEWIGDPAALEQFGRIDPDTGQKRHRFGVFEDGEETDPAVLLQKTWDYLQTINTPMVTYEMNVLDLEEVAGLSHEKVRLGDTVFVIDKEFNPALRIEARVIEIRKDLNDPKNTEIILGNFLPMFTNLASRLKNVESKLDERAGVWDGVERPIDDSDFEDVTPAQPILTATGAFSKVILEWDADFASYMKEYEVYASTVPDFVPDVSNLAGRVMGSFFSYEGEPGQQYYFRVRGVNKAGTFGEMSEEATATTARIISDDLADLLITANKLAAGAVGNDNLDRTSENRILIDSADIAKAAVGSAAIAQLAVGTGHIQDLAVTDAKIKSLSADKIVASELSAITANLGTVTAGTLTGVSLTSDDGVGNKVTVANGELHAYRNNKLLSSINENGLFIYDEVNGGIIGNVRDGKDLADGTVTFDVISHAQRLNLGFNEGGDVQAPWMKFDRAIQQTTLFGSNIPGHDQGRVLIRATNEGGTANGKVSAIAVNNHYDGTQRWSGVIVATGRDNYNPAVGDRFGFEVWQYRGTADGAEKQMMKLDTNSSGQTFAGIYTDIGYFPKSQFKGDSGNYFWNLMCDVDSDVTAVHGSHDGPLVAYIDQMDITLPAGSSQTYKDYTFNGAENIFMVVAQPYSVNSTGMIARVYGQSSTGFRVWMWGASGPYSKDLTITIRLLIFFEP